MKSFSNSITLLSVALAVLLWLAATWFEDDSRWLPKDTSQQTDLSLDMPRPDTPLRANTNELSCQQVEAGLMQDVAVSQYCSANEDCTLFDYGFPIQCMTSVSKQKVTALRMGYRNYEQSCAYRVYYDCPSGNMERRAVCRSNRCEVELVTIDPLKDATLKHLGIKDF